MTFETALGFAEKDALELWFTVCVDERCGDASLSATPSTSQSNASGVTVTAGAHHVWLYADKRVFADVEQVRWVVFATLQELPQDGTRVTLDIDNTETGLRLRHVEAHIEWKPGYVCGDCTVVSTVIDATM